MPEEIDLKYLVGHDFRHVDSVDLETAALLDEAASDGNFKRLKKISDEQLRSLMMRYGHLATEYKWARAMIREELDRKEYRSWLERILLLLLGAAIGILGKWILG